MSKNLEKKISELNEKINSISFRDPTKLNPWRHFNKKRKLEDDQDFIKNPRPVKKIILQPRITNTRVRKGFHWFFILLLSDWSNTISQWNSTKSSPKSSPRTVRHRSSNQTQPSIREFYKPKNWVIAESSFHWVTCLWVISMTQREKLEPETTLMPYIHSTR